METKMSILFYGKKGKTTRDSKKLGDWHSKNPKAKLGSVKHTADNGDIIILSVKGIVAEKVAKTVTSSLVGKTVTTITTTDYNDHNPDGELQGYKVSLGQPGKEFKNRVTFISNGSLTDDCHLFA